MALIRGRSDNADLEHMSRLIHITLFGLKAWFSGSGSLARPTGLMRSAVKASRRHGTNAMGSPRILHFSLRDLVSTTSRVSPGCGVSLSALG